MLSQGREGNNMLWSHPGLFNWECFIIWHFLHDLQKSSTSSAILVHQNQHLTYLRVHSTPRWPIVWWQVLSTRPFKDFPLSKPSGMQTTLDPILLLVQSRSFCFKNLLNLSVCSQIWARNLSLYTLQERPWISTGNFCWADWCSEVRLPPFPCLEIKLEPLWLIVQHGHGPAPSSQKSDMHPLWMQSIPPSDNGEVIAFRI